MSELRDVELGSAAAKEAPATKHLGTMRRRRGGAGRQRGAENDGEEHTWVADSASDVADGPDL